jgi:hypothetical protein
MKIPLNPFACWNFVKKTEYLKILWLPRIPNLDHFPSPSKTNPNRTYQKNPLQKFLLKNLISAKTRKRSLPEKKMEKFRNSRPLTFYQKKLKKIYSIIL